MRERSQVWQVVLDVDGVEVFTKVTIDPPFGIACADAEVKAIKAAQRDGGRNVRCTRSRHISDVNPRFIEIPSGMLEQLDSLVEQHAARTGETPEAVRRAVEQVVFQRGIRAMRVELDEADHCTSCRNFGTNSGCVACGRRLVALIVDGVTYPVESAPKAEVG